MVGTPPKPTSRMDHLVVTAASLTAGAAHIRSALGVELQPGGEHPRMGTHNLVLRLGAALYLEVIAASGSPRLVAWIRTPGGVRSLGHA